MKITIANINALLVQADIEGLIEAGAPVDEYADEAAQITASLLLLSPEQLTEELVLTTISLIWLQSFELSEKDMKPRVPALMQLAKQILL